MPNNDFTGRPLKQGDYFAFAQRYGSSCELKFGRVVETRTLMVGRYGHPGERHKIGAITHDGTSGSSGLSGKGRVQTIERLDNCVIIPSGSVPDAVRTDIGPAYQRAVKELRARIDAASVTSMRYAAPLSESNSDGTVAP